MDSATARMAMVFELVGERHLDANLASWVALAMFPFDDQVRAGRRFRKAARQLADSYAGELADAPDDEIEELTVAALERLRDLATEQGETYYSNHYGKVLAAAADPTTPTLERRCSGCGEWFEGLEDVCSSCGTERKTVAREAVVGPREDEVEPVPQGESGVFSDAEDDLIGTESSEDGEEEPRPDADTVAETSEPLTVATVRVGEAATLRGAAPEIEASVLYVQDPGQADDEVEPDEGMRYVGVFLQIRNTGTETYDDMPSMHARLHLAGGEECEAEVGWLKPDIDELIPIEPGQSAAGFLTFEIEESAELDAFRLVFEAFPAREPPEAALWKLG